MCNTMCKNGENSQKFLNLECSNSCKPNGIKLSWCVQNIPYSCRTNLKLLCAQGILKAAFDNKPS